MDMQPPSQMSADSNPKPIRAGRSRRWRWVANLVLVLLLLLLFFLPALLASPIGRPLLVGYVNEQLNGRIDIKDCSLSWWNGTRISGLVVFDDTGRQILQASDVTSDLTFLEALRGRLRVGRVRVDGLDLLLSREPDGSLNWEHLVRRDSTWHPRSAIPAVTGVLQVELGSLTYEDRFDSSRLPVFLRAIRADVKPSPTGGLRELLSATAQIGSDKPGNILLQGSIGPAAANAVAIEQTLQTRGMNVNEVAHQLGPSWILAGQTDDTATFEWKTSQPSPESAHWVPSTQPR